MFESQSRLLLPLYGQLEVVASSHDNILRVLVPQIVHLRVIDPDNCIAGLQTSRFRRRSGINLQCTMFTQQTNIVFFPKNDNSDESVVDTWPIFQGYADSVLRRGDVRKTRAAIFKCMRYTSNVGYCASIHARTFEKRRFR